MKNNLSLLDCSLRDGGFSVDFNFGYENILQITQLLCDAKVDFVEIGFFQSNLEYDKNRTLFCGIARLEDLLSKIKRRSSKISMMIQYPDFIIDDLPRNNGAVDLVRICPRYSELNASLEFMREVAKKGYSVSIQPAITARYAESELDLCIKTANEIDAYSLYIVDTFGYLEELDIQRFFDKFNAALKPQIRIGFHAHNQAQTAYANTKFFVQYAKTANINRPIAIDSTTFGIGQGPGNLQTELIAPWLNRTQESKYNFLPILDTCEIIEQYNNKTVWGYSIVDLIGALSKVSYKYPHYFRDEKRLSYREIYTLCDSIPNIDDLPARFNIANAEKILRDRQ
jgi:4-hydroxy 2-oxovalerate aldolase